jgi:hypothetical protein
MDAERIKQNRSERVRTGKKEKEKSSTRVRFTLVLHIQITPDRNLPLHAKMRLPQTIKPYGEAKQDDSVHQHYISRSMGS